MESQPLAPVYLDNEPVRLSGEPRPRVAQVVAASGRAVGSVDVVLLASGDDEGGVLVDLNDVLDRTQEPTKAIHLTCVERGGDLDPAEDAAEPPVRPGAFSGPPPGGESLGSPYSRTGTDTAQPGMAQQDARQAGLGGGAGEGSGSQEPGAPTRSRMAAGLEDPFGREGLHGKAEHPDEPEPEPSGLGASRPVRAIGRSGTGSGAEKSEETPAGTKEA